MRFPHGTISKVAAAFMLCTLVFVNLTAAQFKSTDEIKGIKAATNLSSVPGVEVGNNPNCADFDAEWGELKLDFGTPNGTYPFTTGVGVTYDGGSTGIVPNPNFFVNVSSSGANISQWQLTPLSALDRIITAVIIKNGATSWLFDYTAGGAAGSIGDTNLNPGNQRNEISHISFCFGPLAGPSSAPVSISGRALTSDGSGIAYTRIEVMDLSTGEVVSAMTNHFGYYTVPRLEAEAIYMVTAMHKRHTFINNQRTVTPSEDLAGVDFVAP